MSIRENAVPVEVGFEVHIDVKPEVYEPSKAFSNLKLHQRKCILEGEEDEAAAWQLFKWVETKLNHKMASLLFFPIQLQEPHLEH